MEAWIVRRQICYQSGPLHHADVMTAVTTSLAPTSYCGRPHTHNSLPNRQARDLPAAITNDSHDEPGMAQAMAFSSSTLKSPPAELMRKAVLSLNS
jgi:hypothetical protein